TEEFHGQLVKDPYRNLEDSAAPETREWLTAQEALTAQFVGSAPGRPSVRQRLTALTRFDTYSIPVKAAGRYFFTKIDSSADRERRMVYVQDGPTSATRSVWAGAHAMDPGDQLGFIAPSPNGRLLAYGISHHQARSVSVRVVDVASGRDLADRIDGLYSVAAGGSWVADSKAFYYTRFAAPGKSDGGTAGQPTIYVHRLTSEHTDDEPVAGLPTTATSIVTHHTTPDGLYLIASIKGATSGGNDVYCLPLPARAGWIRVTPDGEA